MFWFYWMMAGGILYSLFGLKGNWIDTEIQFTPPSSNNQNPANLRKKKWKKDCCGRNSASFLPLYKRVEEEWMGSMRQLQFHSIINSLHSLITPFIWLNYCLQQGVSASLFHSCFFRKLNRYRDSIWNATFSHSFKQSNLNWNQTHKAREKWTCSGLSRIGIFCGN